MADRMYARIDISGTIMSIEDLNRLMEALEAEAPNSQETDNFDFGAPFGSLADVIVAQGQANGEPLVICDAEAPWGSFPQIEKTCQAIGLTYTCRREAHFDTEALLESFHPETGVNQAHAAQDGQALVPLADLQAAAQSAETPTVFQDAISAIIKQAATAAGENRPASLTGTPEVMAEIDRRVIAKVESGSPAL
jgi:hypothetical protein